jgi:hypothetical protein
MDAALDAVDSAANQAARTFVVRTAEFVARLIANTIALIRTTAINALFDVVAKVVAG